MKTISDILQIALSLPSALGYLAAVGVVLLLWQILKAVGDGFIFLSKALSFIKARLIRLSAVRVSVALLLACPVYFLRNSVSDGLQRMEDYYNPAYINRDTSRALAIYEAELARHCDPYELEVVKRRTREIAARVGCTPLAIYEVAYSECGLNPFRVRADGIAAGWIQFTRAGLAGIGTLEQVKQACRARDIVRIMDWTEAYMVSRANGTPLVDATGVYTCVFAPGFVGHPDSKVLYSGVQNAAYYLNSVFDGYYAEPSGRIVRRRSAMDGRITIGELRLHLEAKKARLIASYQK